MKIVKKIEESREQRRQTRGESEKDKGESTLRYMLAAPHMPEGSPAAAARS